MSITEHKLNLIVNIMQEQLKWFRLAGIGQLRTIFEKNFSSDEERRVYEFSDGERSVRDIEKITNIGRTKISSLWQKWYKMGIMEKSEKYEGRRMRRSFSLADVGIEVNMPDNNETSTEEFE